MLKHLVVIILLSALALFFMPLLSIGITELSHVYLFASNFLISLFRTNLYIHLAIRTVVLVGVPLICSSIVGLIYLALFKKRLSIMINLLWITWLILLVAVTR